MLVGVLIAAAAVAGIAYALSRGSEDGAKAITLVKEQSAPALTRALDSDGALKVSWSASPLGTTRGEDMQLVEATLVANAGRSVRRATFMVDVDTGEVLAQDALAASLLGPDKNPESVHR